MNSFYPIMRHVIVILEREPFEEHTVKEMCWKDSLVRRDWGLPYPFFLRHSQVLCGTSLVYWYFSRVISSFHNFSLFFHSVL